jgi:uncharacterized protein (DUF2141 family)
MKAMLLVWLLGVLPGYVPASSRPAAPDNVTLTVQVYNLRNPQGTVRLSLFRSADGFPSDVSKVFRQVAGKIENGVCTLVLSSLPPGEYAISLLHDENNNLKMDTRLMGIPKEGYGASNDAKVTFGPPKYEDARFVLKGNPETLRIKMRYL